jgi:hypothetical protein
METVSRIAVLCLVACAVAFPSVFPQKNELPPVFGRLKLVKTLEGKEAQAFLDKLHQKAVAPKSSVTGVYEGGGKSATLYISLYHSEREAGAAGSRMMRLIKDGTRVFGHYSEQYHNRLLLGRCVGLGQIHYVFQKCESVFWLSVDPLLESEVLKSLLDSFSPDDEQVGGFGAKSFSPDLKGSDFAG